MANGYFERGEIYWVKMGDSVGMEEAVGRPGLIVSADKENNTSATVVIVYTTKSRARKNDPHSVFTRAALPTEMWVLCNQPHVVDKSRLTKFVGKLTESEMREVDDALEEIFDLGYVDDTVVKEKDAEIEALKAKNAELLAEVAALKTANADELLSVRIETDMWQKLYMKTLDQLVEMKLNGDVSRRMIPVHIEVPPAPVEPAVLPDEKVDINNCTQTALKKIGFSLPMARLIVSRRPYETVADLKTVPGMKSSFFRIVESKLCCTPMPIEPEKVVVVKDAPDPGYEVERKVNVNTATAQEIHDVTGWAISSCYGITGKRKREGLFKSLEEIVPGTRISQKMLEKQRDKLEV